MSKSKTKSEAPKSNQEDKPEISKKATKLSSTIQKREAKKKTKK